MFGGYQAEVGADTRPGEAGPVADLDGQAESGQGRHSAQAAQVAHDGSEFAGCGHLGDGGVESVAAGEGEIDGFEFGIVSGRGAGLVEPDPVQPLVVGAGPCAAAVVDVAVA
ncbi:hypothetical protein GCM10023353_26620 [Tomitella cavernea]|uniref:Uncharacterized protein n=1 Tax=Tomitella cavernea TaxID=1387982 RepID=A0ABP9CTD6_9ACTN